MKGTPAFTLFKFIHVKLYHQAFSSLSDELMAIHAEQKVLVEDSLRGFSFKGKRYCSIQNTFIGIKPLHKSLLPQMEVYLAKNEALNQEAEYVRSYLAALFSACIPLGQCYQALPSSLHQILINRKVERVETPIETLDQVLKYNQKGYDLMLQRILSNLVEF